MNFIQELTWRGLVHDSIPGTEEYLNENSVKGYIGYDPTSDSLHIGNLATVMMLKFFQLAGHTPYVLVGGATAMVGDPSGKDEERRLLSEEAIRYNQDKIQKQLESFLDFDPKLSNAAKVVNNYDWFKEIGFLQFLRDTGKYVTVNYMMGKESVRKRIEGDSGISYTEFAYQLLQGYDFLHLYDKENVQVQMGGSDQWGNLTTGTYLIGKRFGKESQAFAVTCPLITRADGKKFGKSESGENIWLDPERTSPYQFYQYMRQCSDVDAEKLIKVFSLKSQEEIEEIIAQHAEDPGQGFLQKELASELTARVHSQQALEDALMLTEFLFSKNTTKEALAKLSPRQWAEVVKASEVKKISQGELKAGIGILDLLVQLGITKSKGEARRAIEKDKSIRVNAEKWEDIEGNVDMEVTFHNRFFQLQKGKKNKYIVEVES